MMIEQYLSITILRWQSQGVGLSGSITQHLASISSSWLQTSWYLSASARSWSTTLEKVSDVNTRRSMVQAAIVRGRKEKEGKREGKGKGRGLIERVGPQISSIGRGKEGRHKGASCG